MPGFPPASVYLSTDRHPEDRMDAWLAALEPFTDPWLFVVFALAAARATRLVTTDSITAPLRLWASYWDWSRELVHCPWCIGFWISAFFVFIGVVFYPDPWVILPVIAFAVSEVVGILALIVGALSGQPDDPHEDPHG